MLLSIYTPLYAFTRGFLVNNSPPLVTHYYPLMTSTKAVVLISGRSKASLLSRSSAPRGHDPWLCHTKARQCVLAYQLNKSASIFASVPHAREWLLSPFREMQRPDSGQIFFSGKSHHGSCKFGMVVCTVTLTRTPHLSSTFKQNSHSHSRKVSDLTMQIFLRRQVDLLRHRIKSLLRRTQPTVPPTAASTGLERLPTEIIIEISTHLPPSSILALKYCSRRTFNWCNFGAPSALLQSSIDALGYLGMLERDVFFSRSYLVCARCLKMHRDTRFSIDQLQLRPSERICMGAKCRVWMCPHVAAPWPWSSLRWESSKLAPQECIPCEEAGLQTYVSKNPLGP